LGNAIFCFDLGTADATSGAESIFWGQIHPGSEALIG
jgi:hypothetical protein